MSDLDLDAIEQRYAEWEQAQEACYGLPDGEAAQAARCRAMDCGFDVPPLVAEVREMRALFDLQWTRMQRATELWRAEAPAERALVQPDLGALLDWLIDCWPDQRAAVAPVPSSPDMTCCPYCGRPAPVDADGLVERHPLPALADASCPGTGRRFSVPSSLDGGGDRGA